MWNLESTLQNFFGSVGRHVVSATKAAQDKKEKHLHNTSIENANVIRSIADAVYCIELDNEPNLFNCDKKTMPNQFVCSIPSSHPFGPVGSRPIPAYDHCIAYQDIMKDALQKNFKRIIIVEPGVELVKLPLQKLVFPDDTSMVVLGGIFDTNCDFYPYDAQLQYGKVIKPHAVLFTHKVITAFAQLGTDSLCTILAKSHSGENSKNTMRLCAIPALFEKTQNDMAERLFNKVNNMYRNHCTFPMWYLTYALVVVVLLCLILLFYLS